jgi:Carboxypeptidase regulatory-like domain
VRISVRLLAVLRGSLTAATAAGLLAGPALVAPAEAAAAPAPASHARLPLSAAAMQADRRLHDAAQQATSTVTGIVRTAGGSPLADVCVTAYGPAGDKSAVTNSGGRYFISGLRGGKYQFGYRSCAESGIAYLPEWYGSVLQRGESRPVVLDRSTLRRVQPLAPVTLYAADSNLGDLGDLASVAPRHGSDVVASDPFGSHRQLPASAAALAQSVFAGARRAAHSSTAEASATTVNGTISGVVTSPSGHGLKGMCVEAGSPVTGAVGNATTGTGGRYHVKVPAGAYEMFFYTGCGNFGNWLFQIYKNIYNPLQEPTVVTVRKSHTTTINTVMKLGGEISGTVKGPHGQKLSGICVSPLLVHGTDELYFTAVAHNGIYHARALPPGTYQLGFAPCRNTKYAPTLWPDTQSFRAAAVLTVRRGTVISNIDEVMQPGGTVTGTITSATTPPASLAGICVLVEEDGGLYASGIAATGAPGRYTVKGLPPGRYTIVAFPGCYVESNYVEATYPRQVAVYTGATDSGINVALPVGDIISGTVTSAATGKPVPGICVAISLRNGTIVDGTASAQDGTYSVNQLAAGKYEVQFAGGCGNTGSYAPQGYDNTSLFDPQILTFASGGESLNAIDAAMQPGPRISGIVRDTSGQRLTGICVEAVTPAGIVFAAAVSINGTYHLPDLAPGQYQVIFGPGCGNAENLLTEWYPSQLSPAATISASSGTVTGINAHLPPAGAISGEVRTASGKRVWTSCLVLTGLSGLAKGLASEILLDGAQYELAGVPTGRWQVAFVPACAGLKYATQFYKDKPSPAFATAITVRPLRTVKDVNSKLVAGGSISGRLTSAGKPASQVCVEAQNVSVVDDFGGATTNSKGDYTIYGLNSGNYELEAYPCGPASSDLATVVMPKAVRVAAPRNTGHVNDRMGLSGAMTGQVLGGSPVTTQPNVCVEAIAASGLGSGAVTTNRSGKYTISGLTPGNFTVHVGAPSCTYGDQDLAPLWYPDATTQPTAQTLTVTAGATTALSPVTLADDGSISGTVTQQGGAALHGACVAATQISPAPGQPVYSVTGSDGSYSITDLPPGNYRVRFSSGCGANGYQTQWWNDESSSISATPVSVTAGTATTGISPVLNK